MFIVIYKFEVIQGQELAFEAEWERLTHAFMNYADGLGSRLHKDDRGNYIAYAQWPDEKSWKEAGSKLPSSAQKLSKQMRDRCSKFEVLHTLYEVKNVLQANPEH